MIIGEVRWTWSEGGEEGKSGRGEGEGMRRGEGVERGEGDEEVRRGAGLVWGHSGLVWGMI